MESNLTSFPTRQSRLGFHYYPDTLHYRDSDLGLWLPRLKSLGVSWLVLQSSAARAIPENFITGLSSAGIEPVIHFETCPTKPIDPIDMTSILGAYGRWGVHGVIFNDQPNCCKSWSASAWIQDNLVERFLDRFLPLAERCLEAGLTPVLPPLAPGGSYWDTVFLRSTLEAMDRRKRLDVLDHLVLSAYAWTGGHPLNWGVGGPERWPAAYPYSSGDDHPDQRGFRISDWYQAIVQSVLAKNCPVILLQAGVHSNPRQSGAAKMAPKQHAQINLAIARLLAGETVSEPGDSRTFLEPIAPEVIACNLWLLAADKDSPYLDQAWFPEGQTPLPSAKGLAIWNKQPKSNPAPAVSKCMPMRKDVVSANTPPPHPIQHYLLLPTYEWGVADWQFNAILPFVKKHKPTVGFSLADAALAARVTVIGDGKAFPEEVLDRLRQAGSFVERINGDGTNIATLLAER